MEVQKHKLLARGGVIGAGLLLGLAISGFGGSIAHSVRGKFRTTTVASRFVITDYLSSHSLRKLQIGAGDNQMPGWLNTDIEPFAGEAYLDASKHFPLPDGSFAYIFGEHVIEHLSPEDGLSMLKESRRILAPGGKIRIATPNLLKFIQLFQDGKTDEMRRYMQGKIQWHGWPHSSDPECMILNLQLRSWGHQFVYDPRTLRDSLARAGFQAITEFAPGESDDPQLRGIEARHNSGIRAVNDYETMVFQAVRPQ